MKLTLLSLLVFGLVAFTFAAPVMEEDEDEDQVDSKSVIVDGPDKPTNEVVKIDNNDNGEVTPLSDAKIQGAWKLPPVFLN
ncbi:hypothetical protein AC249_AIPGENE8669 [Exaiptasia diaphana]|nr:hypothetical protein AC249_AIPGENE8669 [Exaiptasia diaphana]